MLFDGWSGLGRAALLAVLGYAWLVVVLRLYGKRTLAKLNAFDFVVTVALGSILATTILSKSTTWSQGALAVVVLCSLQWLVAKASLNWPWLFRMTRSTPRLLLLNGSFLEKAMEQERIGKSDIRASVRKHGAEALDKVHAVVLETDGTLSVIAKPGDGSTLCDVIGYDEARGGRSNAS
ncbi:DUF421 domain-containing protein [Tsuneonella deserti]|uniref:DUF421 domain-containing protein n=2 Tax=Tsuneonella deserti TaxID=2035528 RepID=A0ABQ1S596_9SPHN|nr:DUF421 domain-containing protein [Tsuneonella deserti]